MFLPMVKVDSLKLS